MRKAEERRGRAARQTEIIDALKAQGAVDVAERLMRCAAAHSARRRDAWPWRCRGAACAWCGPAAARRWWHGIRRWAEAATKAAVAVAVIPAGRVGAAPRLRRALRDIRDRAARNDRRWQAVAIAGMLVADGGAVVLVVHNASIPRETIERALQRRWPAVVFPKVLPDPDFAFPAEAAVQLASLRRGVEPLRAIVMPQRLLSPGRNPHDRAAREPMPMTFAIGVDAESFWGPPLGAHIFRR